MLRRGDSWCCWNAFSLSCGVGAALSLPAFSLSSYLPPSILVYLPTLPAGTTVSLWAWRVVVRKVGSRGSEKPAEPPATAAFSGQ